MKIPDLQQDLKRYMLYERGLTVKTHKAIVATLKMLMAHCMTEDIKAFTEEVIREFFILWG